TFAGPVPVRRSPTAGVRLVCRGRSGRRKRGGGGKGCLWCLTGRPRATRGRSGVGLLRLRRALAEGHRDRDRLTVAVDRQFDLIARFVVEDQHVEERVSVVDALPVERGDDVAGLQTSRRRRAARFDRDDALAALQRLALDAQVGARDLPGGNDLV